MLDTSTMTDEELLQLTAAWDEPDYTNTCEDCGREYELRPNMASGRGRWCDECREAHRAGERKTFRPSSGGIKTGRMVLKRAYDGGN